MESRVSHQSVYVHTGMYFPQNCRAGTSSDRLFIKFENSHFFENPLGVEKSSKV